MDVQVVVIAPAGLVVALQNRIPTTGRIVLFRDTDALTAWDTILTHRPSVIALDPQFVATSRGAALVTQAKAEPSLAGSSFRVLTLEDDDQRVRLLEDCHEAPEAAILTLSRPLDRCGTRTVPRFPLVAGACAFVNGQPVDVIDLSTAGIRLVSRTRLRPAEEFRLTIALHDTRVLRLRAVTAWSTLQPDGPVLTYRAGAQFVDSDPARLAAYCHGAEVNPDPNALNPVETPAPSVAEDAAIAGASSAIARHPQRGSGRRRSSR